MRFARLALAGFAALLGSAYPAQAGLRLRLGVETGLAQAKSADGSAVPQCTLMTFSGHAFPGWNLGALTVGVHGEYFLAEQLTDPVTVGNQNLRGSGYLSGAAATLQLGSVLLTAGIDVLGKDQLGTPTADGLSSAFTHPVGFRASLGIPLSGAVYLNFSTRVTTYSHESVGGTDVDLGASAIHDQAVRVGLELAL